MNENSGGDVNYYLAEVKHPKRAEPYMAECEDIIAALGMTFFEGELFKAVWRKAAQRTLGVGKAGNTALRDAQKMAHYGARCLAIEQQGIMEYALGDGNEQVLGGWIPHDGKGCPAPNGTRVVAQRVNGTESAPFAASANPGSDWCWEGCPGGYCFTAYKVVPA